MQYNLRIYIQCLRCERSQSIDYTYQRPGVTVDEAFHLGWAHNGHGFVCPFHSDKGTSILHKLAKVKGTDLKKYGLPH
jgi:hypothetical protein